MAQEPSKRGHERIYHWLFQIGIWLKGIDGLLELAGGVLFLIASPQKLNHFIIIITQPEISEDPGDWFSNVLRHMAHQLSVDKKLVAAAYLLGNGVVKVFLAAGILRGKFWCYPTAIVVISALILLEGGRLAFHFSFPMLAGMAVDLVIVGLIFHEYRRIRASKKT